MTRTECCLVIHPEEGLIRCLNFHKSMSKISLDNIAYVATLNEQHRTMTLQASGEDRNSNDLPPTLMKGLF